MDPLSGFFGSLLWWLFFLYLLMWPQLQFRALQAARAKLMAQLARKRNSTVIAMIHRQESIASLGYQCTGSSASRTARKCLGP